MIHDNFESIDKQPQDELQGFTFEYPKTEAHYHIRLFWESVMIRNILISKGYELISADKFHFAAHMKQIQRLGF